MTWKPSRTVLNFVIDVTGLLLMLFMLYTGFLIRFVLPPGSTGRHGGRGLTLLGMDRHDWGDLHFWVAVALVALLLLHVALHWSWVCGLWRRWRNGSRRARTVSGTALLLGLVLLLGGLIWWSAASVEDHVGPRSATSTQSKEMQRQPSPGGSAERSLEDGSRSADHAERDEMVRGSMTLREVADASHVPVDHLKSSLGLPGDTSERERLGRLRRRFGFQIDQVRRLIAAYRKP